MSNYYNDIVNKEQYLDRTRMEALIRLREGTDVDAGAIFDGYLSRLDEVGRIAGEKIAPRAKDVDLDSATCVDGKVSYAPGTVENLKDLADAGLMGVLLPKQYGGLYMPVSVYTMMTQMISRADASLQNLFGLQDIAETIKLFGTDDQKERYLPKFASGEYDGAMALTEPEAGSDLQSVQTSAVQGEDGVWRINGLKHFITNGCAKVLLVLARSEAGTKDARGLSLFIVKGGPEVVINRIEDKLGIHGSPTCEVQFNDAPGELLGQRRFGLIKYVMSLMNGARLAISSQASGLSEAALALAHEYTGKRVQFGKSLDKIPPVTDMLERMDVLSEAERTLLFETCYYVDMRDIYEELAQDRSNTEAKELSKFYTKVAALMTPMTKFFNTEAANAIAYDTIQCMGGKGYMRERIAERYYRDARIMNIYEGTSQMQVVAATGGIMTHVIDPLVDELVAEIEGCEACASLLAKVKEAKVMADAAVECMSKNTDHLERLAKRLVRMETVVYVSLLMLRNAVRNSERLAAARHFIAEFLPEVAYSRDMINAYLENHA